ncbi:glycosyltransferase [Candidatus Pelagibacter sp.]|nr:glycosyltransferase [Candidatus Pelagibacter sp.]
MKSKLKISVITVTKNSEKFLEENINSLTKQTYKNFEHIIIDGQSTDKTIQIIKKNSHKISYWKSEPDKSLYDAMNKGIRASTGDIIGILNSDDIYYPSALEIVNKYFTDNPNLDFLFGTVEKYKLLYGFYPKKIKWTFGFYTTHSVGFFIKKSSQNILGLYDTQYKYSADYDLFYRMIVKKKMIGKATKKNEILGKFRQGGLSSRISYLDFLKENNKIRLNNGQNRVIVYLIFILRLIRNFKNIFK